MKKLIVLSILSFIISAMEAKPIITYTRSHSAIWGNYDVISEAVDYHYNSEGLIVLDRVDVECKGNGAMKCKTDYGRFTHEPVNGFTEPEWELINDMYDYAVTQQEVHNVPSGSYTQNITVVYNGVTYQFAYTSTWSVNTNNESVVEISSVMLNNTTTPTTQP